MQYETPYDHGKRCFELGYDIGDNPYRAGTCDAHDWIDGLLDARDASKSARVSGAAEANPPSGAGNDSDASPRAREVA